MFNTEVTVSFANVDYTVMEDVGNATLDLIRIGNIPVTVNITTFGGTAVGEIWGNRHFTVAK